jgi:hypothetical protein
MKYLSLFIGLLLFFFVPVQVLASNYGDGGYGECTYGGGGNCTATGGSSSIASAVSSAGSAVSTFFCSNQAPSSAPNLYQINVTNTTATVYFSPAGGPYDRHYISYGPGNNSEGNGVEIMTSQSNGALNYQITQLSPGTTYTFKVRAGNGCKPGPWSSNLTVKTQSQGTKALTRFYPNKQAQYIAAKPASWTTKAKVFISDLLPNTPNTGHGPNTQVLGAKTKRVTGETKHQNAPSLWDTVASFFTGLF